MDGASIEDYKAKVKGILEKLVMEGPAQTALMDVMKTRLENCGWVEQVKLECHNAILRQGTANPKLDEIVEEVMPVARAKVPTEVKMNLVSILREALLKELGEESETDN